MATVIDSRLPYVYHQQPYYYPTLTSVTSSLPVPNYYNTPQQNQPTTVQYVDSGVHPLYSRRQPRVYREVIRLPTPEPVYRQVRHRMPTPERQVIKRTIIHKADGNVFVQQQRPTTKTRPQSRTEPSTRTRSSRSRQIHTD